jgi:DNA-binding HxlR family transcriptional regulator
MESRLGSQLGDKIKINMILALYTFGVLKKTELYAKAGRSNINARKLDELETSGIVCMETDRFQNNITTVRLTAEGQVIASKLIEIEGILSGEVAPVDAGTDYDPFTKQGDTVN